jgi:CYTH domain-containing protein
MHLEIERKFLIAHDGWKLSCTRSIHIRDGLIAAKNGRKVRVRIADDKATLAVKGKERGFARAEYEYDIPVWDAEEMLRMCDGLAEKIRHIVPYAGSIWEVDVYEGILSGIVIAEVELSKEGQVFHLPDWIGKEITDNPNYKKANMLAKRVMAKSAGGLGEHAQV